MKTLVCLFTFFFSFQLSAKEYNYIQYHSRIAEAETALVNEDFKSALDIYKKTFSDFPFKFSVDLYHALQLAVLLDNKKDCAMLLDSSLAYGVPLKCLYRCNIIQKYLSGLDSNKVKNQAIVGLKKNQSRIDLPLRMEWKKRYQCEQNAKSNRDDEGESYMVCLKDNITALKNYLEKYKQFPGEKIIGVCTGFKVPVDSKRQDATYKTLENGQAEMTFQSLYADENDEDCGLSNDFVIPTLLHTGISFADLKKLLDACLVNGTMHPRDYMYLLEFEKTTGKRQVGYLKYYKTLEKNLDLSCYTLCYNMGWGNGCDDNVLADACRQKIGICNVETDRKKKVLARKYGFDFLNSL